MRWWLVILALCLIPLAAAGELKGWYYSGDTFTHEGVVYSVEGTDEASVLLGVAGRLYFLNLYECRTEGLSEYCYVDTAYPDDEDHIKYEAGERLYGYYLTVTTSEPDISVDQDFETTTPEPKEEVPVVVTITNAGDFTVNNILYELRLPDGIVRTTGPGAGQVISFSQRTLRFEETTKFTYKIRSDAFGDFVLAPTFTYEFNGKVENVSIGKTTIKIATPVEVETFATQKVTLDKYGSYQANITSIEETDEIDIIATIVLPSGLKLRGDPKGMTLTPDGVITASFTLEPDEVRTVSFDYNGLVDGTHKIPLQLVITKEASSAKVTYDASTEVDAQTLVPTLQLSSKKGSHLSGAQLSVTAILKNENEGSKFTTIRGTIASDLFVDVPFSREQILAKEEASERVTFAIPEVNASTKYPITFRGSYTTSGGKMLEFSVTETITATPRTSSVVITRTLDPKTPERGGNVTVTVSAKNTIGQYLTLDASEKIPQGISTAGGLLYKTVSLNADETQQLYVYQLLIPQDAQGPGMNLTTVIRPKDAADPEEYSTFVLFKGETMPTGAQEEDDIGESPDANPAEDEEEKKELGFFASIWDFLKGLFD